MVVSLFNTEGVTPRVNLENHHKMIKLRRLSDRMVEVLAKDKSYDKAAEVQALHKKRKELRASMPPLRVVSPCA